MMEMESDNMAESHAEFSHPRLSELFNEIYSIYRYLEASDESSNAEPIQNKVRDGLEKCELAINVVNELSLFSNNEALEEVATNEIRYMLLPALMGYFTLKSCHGARIDLVKKAKVYFTDFLRLCKLYKASDVDTPDSGDEEEEDAEKTGTAHQSKTQKSRYHVPDHAALSRARQAKIEQFKQKKAIEQKLRELFTYVNKDHVDEEVKREYYIKLLDQWVIISTEELENTESEQQILEHMAKHHGNDSTAHVPVSKPKAQPLRPFIITKNALQKQVFGLGYPGIPTVTVEEYYRQQVARGVFPGADAPQPELITQDMRDEQQAADSVTKEALLERDDEAALRQAREWDDWKDDHRTGWGNTKNMG